MRTFLTMIGITIPYVILMLMTNTKGTIFFGVLYLLTIIVVPIQKKQEINNE